MASLVNKFIPKINKSVPADHMAFVVEGPPGTGKSTLCGSMAEFVGAENCLLIATLAREMESWKYKTMGIPYVLIEDPQWAPSLKSFSATGFSEFRQLVRWLREEDEQYEAIILDSGTELAECAWHAALAPFSAGSPAEIGDGKSRWLPYETLNNLLDEGIKDLLSLTTVAKRPKHVGVTWHVQPPKDGLSADKESADKAGKGVEYEGDVLPMVRGQYRRKLGGMFPTVVFTDVQVRANMGMSAKSTSFDVQYMLQVRPDNERHTKLSGPLPSMQYIPNDFKALRDLVRSSNVAGVAPSATPAVKSAGTISGPAASSLSRK